MKKLFLIVVGFLFQLNIFATHIVGGDITVKHISGNTFEVKLTFYRDCASGNAAFDNNVTLGVYDKVTNTQLSTFTLPRISSSVKPLGDACFTPSVCVEEGIYSANVTLANNTNGCYISWQRCCRNGLINNIVNPLNAGMVFYAEIPNPALHNSSPVFGSYPKAYMCVGNVNLENFSATDIDGDQLVYSLVTPLNGNATQGTPNPSPSAGPYSTITWQSPYSLSNIMGGTPVVGINSQTGIVNANPNQLGVYVFAVRVEEYRNGVKIGEIRRDVQYQVITCQNTNIPGSSPTLTCTNPTAVITCGSSVPNVTYSWTGPGIVSGANTSSPTVNAGGYYTVVVTQPSGCSNTSYILVNTNQTQPNLTTNPAPTLTCTTTSGTISASSSTSGVTYTWAGTGITSGANTSSPTVNAANTFTVTVTNPANGCTRTGTVTVTANTTKPNITTNPAPTLTCTTTSGTISANSTTSGVTYAWTGTGIVSGGNTSSPTINAAGNFNVTITNPANGCTSTGTVTVTSNTTQPDLTTGNSLTLTCTTIQGNISASSNTSGVTYVWTGAGIVSGNNTSTPTVNSTGTYTVTLTNPSNGCTRTGTVTVTSNTTQPNVSVNTESGLLLTCVNTSGTINANSTTPNATYNWNGPGIVSGNNTNSPTVNAIGNYTVTVTNPANGCTKTAINTVTNNLTPPNLTSNSNVTLTCANPTGTITANSTTQGATFNWNGPGIVSGGSSANAIVNAPGSYTVVATNPGNGCTNSTSLSVAQNITQPIITTAPGITLTCSTTTGSISASSNIQGNANYQWTGSGIVSGATASAPTVNNPGTYTVTITNPVNGCSNTATINVLQNITIPNVTTSPASTLTCSTTNISINASSSTQNVNYAWNGSGIVSGSNTASPTINQPGSYTVTITNPVNGCTNTASVAVNQDIALPNVSAGPSLTLNCVVSSGNINATSSTNGVNYSWTGTSIINGNNTSSPLVNGPGTYTVTVTNPNNGCTNTTTVTAVLDNIQPSITAGNPLTLTCTLPSSTITATSNTQGINYTWTGANIISGANSSSPTVNGAGTYTVVITNPVNGCTNSTTVSVTANQVLPTITPGNTLTLTCVNTSNTISVNSSNSNLNYNWSGPGIVSGSNTSSPLVNTTGTYIVVATDASNGCTSTTSVLVNDNLAVPNLTTGGNLVLTCTSTSGNINASSSTNGVSYTWSGANIISGNNNPTAIVNATGTYTITITDPVNGCTNSATVTVTNDTTLPQITTGPNLTLTCVNTSGTINATSNDPTVNYNWNGPGIVSGNNTSSPTVNTPGTYTITVTDPTSGCQSLGTVNVINDIATPNLIAGSSLTLNCLITSDTINVSTSVSNATYNWTGANIVSGGNTASPIVNGPGTYTVVVTNPVNGCTSTTTVLVNNNTQVPQLEPGQNATLNCTINQVNISATSISNVNYNWNGPGIVTNGNTSSPTVNQPGAYVVTITDPTNGCTSSATIMVNQNIATPDIAAGLPLTLTCTNTNGIVTASSSTPNVSYAWVGANIIANGNTAAATVNAPGTYTVTIVNPINGCTATATVNVLLNDSIPDINATSYLTLNCINRTDTLFANSPVNGITYNWSGPGIIANGNTATPIVNVSGTYTVTVTNPQNGCTNTATTTVSANLNIPNLTAVSPVILNCLIPSDTLSASSTTSNISYSWNGPAIVSGANTSSPIVNNSGIYIVTITDSTNGCTAIDTVTVIKNIATPNLSTSGTFTLTCINTSGNISASSSVPNVSYNWSGPSIVSGGTTATPVINGAGTYVVTIVDPANGCTNTDSVKVNDNIINPLVTAGPQLILTCNISSSSISATSNITNANYNWNGPGIIANGNTATPTVNTAGVYTVTVTNPNNGCTATATVTATIAPPPLAVVNPSITINIGDSTSLLASGGVNYLWTPATGLSCTTCDNPIATPTATTTYCVLVTDQYGCSDSACVTVTVNDPCASPDKEPEFPNVFTPNNDGTNDLFLIKDWNNECIISFSIEIYDRWGIKLFSSDQGLIHWDGRTGSGLEVPAGTYFYIINVHKYHQEPKAYKGSISLMR